MPDCFFKLERSGVRTSYCKAEIVIHPPQLQNLKYESDSVKQSSSIQCKDSMINIYETLSIRYNSLRKLKRKPLNSVGRFTRSAPSSAGSYRSWSMISSPGLGKTIVV